MLTLRRAKERHHEHRWDDHVWSTLLDARDAGQSPSAGLEAPRLVLESRLSPQTMCDRPTLRGEIVTYVHAGTLEFTDSNEQTSTLGVDEFQVLTLNPGAPFRLRNASTTEPVHFFQVFLQEPIEGLEPGRVEKRFGVAERRGALRIVVSQDGRRGSLRVRHDLAMYSAILLTGQHIIHPLEPKRQGWLQVVHGTVTICGHLLDVGDGTATTDERVVSVTATGAAEILLLDSPTFGS